MEWGRESPDLTYLLVYSENQNLVDTYESIMQMSCSFVQHH